MSFTISYTSAGSALPTLRLPLSKSVAARVACLDFLSGAAVRMHTGVCDDERVLADALHRISCGEQSIDVGESGTALRLLTALISARPGAKITLQGRGRLMERPMKPLLDALRELGAPAVQYPAPGHMEISGAKLHGGGAVEIDGTVSSQFVSALMLIAPSISGGLTLRLTGGSPVSAGYIDMTRRIMQAYGVHVSAGECEITVPESVYCAPEYYIKESDWSAASYLYELAALSGKTVTVSSLTAPAISLQGDSIAAGIFADLGVRTLRCGEAHVLMPGKPKVKELRRDMSGSPDLVPAVLATCMGLGIPCEISGVEHLRHKESDRLSALTTEFGKMGVNPDGSGLRYTGTPALRKPVEELCAYGDHRMAMSMALLATRWPIKISGDPQVVDKSFPDFWQEMKKAGITLS